MRVIARWKTRRVTTLTIASRPLSIWGFPTVGDKMKFWTWIKEMLFGCKLIKVSEIETVIVTAIKDMDKDGDDYVSVNELVDFIKDVLKRY